MYRVELKLVGDYDKIAFVFKEYEEATDFISMALGRSVEELEVKISEVKEEEQKND